MYTPIVPFQNWLPLTQSQNYENIKMDKLSTNYYEYSLSSPEYSQVVSKMLVSSHQKRVEIF